MADTPLNEGRGANPGDTPNLALDVENDNKSASR